MEKLSHQMEKYELKKLGVNYMTSVKTIFS